ncbi:hypothetical protein JKF63_02150 [Porcisia hertigi]|uniref:Uncharacterized protein n=1 Tax=Porcisia hertigi TaxID=2761500 RepID=A0A836L2S2_9TRYP|nr:hypothetical protein JKF63_02150 [Porcisia hertigi]
MRPRPQLSNSPLLLSEYFMVCKMYSDTATARETHQRYIPQVENKRSVFTAQTLRGSEQGVSTDAGAAARIQTSASAPPFPPFSQLGSYPADLSSPARTERDAMQPSLQRPPRSVSPAAGGDEVPPPSGAAPQHSRPTASTTDRPSATLSTLENHDTGGLRQGPPLLRQSSGLDGSSSSRSVGVASQSVANTNTHSAASYAIFRRDWGPEKYDEEFQRPWNAFLHELSGAMVDVVTAWVSDLEEQTSPSRHLVRLSSTCCYDSAHGICLLRWNTMREVRAYVDALHAVVNAPLSEFCVPLTLGMEVLGVPVLCMSLAPVSGP